MKLKAVFICLVAFIGYKTNAQTQTLNTKHYNLKGNLAVEGYDVVSYFNNKHLKGDVKYSTTSQGVVYYFSSQVNKDLFLKTPEKYKPQYGGWCAYAMGYKGEKVEVDPETYKIVNSNFSYFLFYFI